jgi:hypothetical protein
MIGASDLFLFVSHVSEDRDAAMAIVDELERRGIKCWIAPRNVHPGTRFDDEISDAIDACRALLLIFSDQCNESEYILREIHVAGQSQKVIIPFRIENAHPRRGLRVRLSDLHWIDGFVSRERAIDDLVRHLLSPAAPTRPAEELIKEVAAPAQPARENSQPAQQSAEKDAPPPAGKRNLWPLIAAGLAGVAAILVVAIVAVRVGWVSFGPSPPTASSQPTSIPPAHLPDERDLMAQREQQAYNAARGNLPALRGYVGTCQVCAFKAAAQTEIQQLEEAARQAARADREQQAYNAARGNLPALRNYVSTCQVCAFKTTAQTEIGQLEAAAQAQAEAADRVARADREQQAYNTARGDPSALRLYVNTCQICTYASAARDEIGRLSRCSNSSNEDVLRPIKLVYQAINSRNLDLYAAQWDDDATSHDVFVNETHTKAEKVDSKRKQFDLWDTVNLTMQQITLLNHGERTAGVEVSYSMTFKFKGQAPRSRSGIIERYDLICNDAGTWVIKHNEDEINIRQ